MPELKAPRGRAIKRSCTALLAVTEADYEKTRSMDDTKGEGSRENCSAKDDAQPASQKANT